MSFQYSIKHDDGCVSTKFIFTLENDITCTIEMSEDEPAADTLAEWATFIYHVENNSKGSIVFDDCNGQVSIETADGKTSFFVSRGGGDGYGDINITVPNTVCSPMFKNMVAEIKKIET